jgi:ferredoxin
VKIMVDPTACEGRGLCAELLPERIGLDRFGFPVIAEDGVGGELEGHARRAVAMCPHLALHLVVSDAPAPVRRPR